MINDNYLKEVREQYENYPFPHRNPEDERKRLLIKPCDYLEKINHYLYRGKQNFKNFRVLVAGGGTGDATIFLAEQLKELGGKVTHLDMSQASIAVAQKRAKIRGLTNIEWIHDSILNIPQLNLQPFDYINCLGVLHHMKSPDDGLTSLKSALNENGAMCLMIYGSYGRTGLYQTQELMKRVNAQAKDITECIQNTRDLLPRLPYTNWLIRFNKEGVLNELLENDSSVYDALLHPCDRSYTVPQVYEFVEKAGLHFVEFTGFAEDDLQAKQLSHPAFYLRGSPLAEKLAKLPYRDQQAIAEIMVGTRALHTFYAAQQPNTMADIGNLNNVPFFFNHPPEAHKMIAQTVENAPNKEILVAHHLNTGVRFQPGPYTKYIFRYLNGRNSLKEIFDRVRADSGKNVSDADLTKEFQPIFESLFELDILLLRDKSVPQFQTT